MSNLGDEIPKCSSGLAFIDLIGRQQLENKPSNETNKQTNKRAKLTSNSTIELFS